MQNDATDIVERLRDTTAGYTVQTVFDEAADEIERLRNDATRMRGAVLRLTSEMEILRERLETARRMGGGCAREQLATAINERDEARKEILESMHPDRRQAYADARGWHLYRKDGTNGD